MYKTRRNEAASFTKQLLLLCQMFDEDWLLQGQVGSMRQNGKEYETETEV